jgi:hypothetical protein
LRASRLPWNCTPPHHRMERLSGVPGFARTRHFIHRHDEIASIPRLAVT